MALHTIRMKKSGPVCSACSLQQWTYEGKRISLEEHIEREAELEQRAEARKRAAAIERGDAQIPAETTTLRPEARPATQRQIDYIISLVRQGFADNLSIKLPRDLRTLTLDQASVAIGEMRGEL